MEKQTVEGPGYSITYNTDTMLGDIDVTTGQGSMSLAIDESDLKLLLDATEADRTGIVQQFVNRYKAWRAKVGAR